MVPKKELTLRKLSLDLRTRPRQTIGRGLPYC